MKKIAILILVFSLNFFVVNAQNVGIGTDSPHVSAKLEVASNNSGFLPPRMTTTQRNTIVNPVAGLQIYNTTTDCLEIFSKGRWQKIFCGVDDTTTNVDSTLVTDIDGHIYPTVKICNQTWMAKNLDVARYRNGDIIPQVTDPTEWANLTTGAWCWYNNDSATYGSVYGRLYNWYAVNDPRGLAPEGWHVPSNSEWDMMTKCLDETVDTTCNPCWSGNNIGTKLKNSTGWYNGGNGTNGSDFGGLPGGYRLNLSFNEIGSNAIWWSTSEYNSQNSWAHLLGFDYSGVFRFSDYKTYGFSVRCVKDTPITTLNDGLVAYYPFNGNANDESGNGNNGTVNGASLTTDRFGDSGKAYSFDGLNNVINIPTNHTLVIQNNIAISAWIKRKNPSNLLPEGIFGPATYLPTTPGYYLRIINKKVDLGISLPYTEGFSTTTIDSSHWYHVVGVYDNNSIKIYISGVMDNETFAGPDLLDNWSSTNFLTIGQEKDYGTPTNLHSFDGSLDDIRIYNRALTQEEITYLATH
jgi:uncharacterized protein (TIGR02145 family)